ncbi:MAG TPA: sugar ABC transporter permease [Candidatus Limnocylindrales bacterium]|jgi:multiple sugar transport system permease protein|nr:sugar ABC transporter permease [Candidatus Limnocylindrales bacterium]
MVGERGWRKVGLVSFFLLPALLPLLIFRVLPMVASVGVSLTEWNLLRPPVLVGLDNYLGLLGDKNFHRALVNTLYYMVGYLPLVLVGALATAVLLNSKLKGSSFFRGVYFLPVVTSWVVVALLWKWLLSPEGGMVNYLLSLVGIDGPGWWTDRAWAMPSIILASAWKDLGFSMLILLAGLQNIPEHLYEAARIDGAGRWQRLRHITLPLLTPFIFFAMVLSMIGAFQVFDQVWIMTEGGPAGATTVVMEQVVKNAFKYGLMGEASAMSWVLFAIILAFTVVQLRAQRRWVHYGS